MNSYKVKVWEHVSVWQTVTVIVNADSPEELDKVMKNGSFEIQDWIDADPDWNTESHISFEPEGYEVIGEFPANSTYTDWGNP